MEGRVRRKAGRKGGEGRFSCNSSQFSVTKVWYCVL